MSLLLSCCERLTDFFISQCGLPETRRSWYIYTLQTRISMFLSTAGMMLLGCLVATPYQVICFLVGILSLRRRLGGYHAKTPLRCLFLSIGVSILCLSIVKTLFSIVSQFLFGFYSSASLLLFSIHLLIAIQTARLRLMNLLFPGQKRSIFLYGICF